MTNATTATAVGNNPIISNTFEVVRLPKPKEIDQIEEVLNAIEQQSPE
jgi:hypothetical protein